MLKKRSFALIITLFFISILSLLLVSLTFNSSISLKIINNSKNNYLLDINSKSVYREILWGIQREIYKKSESTNGNFITPLKREFFTTHGLFKKNISETILDESANSLLVFNQNYKLSKIPITKPSLNNIYISKDSWTSSKFEEDLIIPNWIYIENSLKSANKSLEIKGRFAYTIYDYGNKLNINRYGGIGGGAKGREGESSVMLNAERYLELAEGSLSDFFKWKSDNYLNNKDHASDSSELEEGIQDRFILGDGINLLYGDNNFFSRKELISAKTIIPNNSLKKITHFSRMINQPNYNAVDFSAYSFSSSINKSPNELRVLQTYIRGNNIVSKKGDIFLDRRFPLDWIENVKSDSDKDFLLNNFGLQWNSTLNTWEYVDAEKSSGAIKTIFEVINQRRDPNFFELLKFGILNGSLGLDAGVTMTDNRSIDQNIDIQVLRIGLNIIDMFDGDSFPTTLIFQKIELYGQENLPHISKILLRSQGTSKSYPWLINDPWAYYVNPSGFVFGGNPPYYGLIFYELWNPYQQKMKRDLNKYPDKIRFSALSGSYNVWYKNNISFYYSINQKINVKTNQNIHLNVSQYLDAYSEPKPIQGSPDSKITDDISAFNINSYNNFNGQGFISNSSLNLGVGVTELQLGLVPQNVIYAMQYQTKEGQWVNYTSFAGQTLSTNLSGGVTANPFSGHDQSTYMLLSPPLFNPSLDDQNTPRYNSSFVKIDPRTQRFGVSLMSAQNVNPDFLGKTMRPQRVTDNSSATWFSSFNINEGWGVVQSTAPFSRTTGSFSLSQVFNRIAHMAENRYNRGTPSNIYRDRDGVNRWGDSGYDNDAKLMSLKINPMEYGVSTNRPIILDRGARSVADLGYVYRDMPWKSLDFFTTNSADMGLLELFQAHDQPKISGGALNLNNLSKEQIKSLLVNVERSPRVEERKTYDIITEDEAETLSQFYFDRIHSVNKSVQDRTDLVSKMNIDSVNNAFPATKFRREAPLRALVENTQTRVWNLMIDFVYQNGSISEGSSNLEKFHVHGTTRKWIHLSIDRLTGELIDSQIEDAL